MVAMIFVSTVPGMQPENAPAIAIAISHKEWLSRPQIRYMIWQQLLDLASQAMRTVGSQNKPADVLCPSLFPWMRCVLCTTIGDHMECKIAANVVLQS